MVIKPSEPLPTLVALHEWLSKQGWPEEILVSGDDYTRLLNKFSGLARNPRFMHIGPTIIRPKMTPKIDLSGVRVLE
jgi:hypothetical protein